MAIGERHSQQLPGAAYVTPPRTSGALSLLIAAVFALLAIAIPTTAAAECANEARREEQGVFGISLPECRAYEMVTPPIKGSGEPKSQLSGEDPARQLKPLQAQDDYNGELVRFGSVRAAYAATDGNRIAWMSEPFPAATTPGANYLSTRTAAGWASAGVVPPVAPQNGLVCPEFMVGVLGPNWSSDLTKVVLEFPGGPSLGFKEEKECGHEEPRLVPGEPERGRNLFLHDNLSGSNQLINITPEDEPWFEWPVATEGGIMPPWAYVVGGSDDLGHVAFEAAMKLTEDAPVGYPGGNTGFNEMLAGELYEWTDGQVRLVTYLPDGTPVPGQLASATRGLLRGIFNEGPDVARYRHAVSADGARIFWEDGVEPKSGPGSGNQGDLYLREDGVRTLRIDAAQDGAPDPSGGGDFWWASADGSRAFFTSDHRLTADSTAESGSPDLYEWRSQGTGDCVELDGCVEDLTAHPGEAAAVLGVSGGSEDGTHVYFVARGALTDAPNPEGETATPSEPNLYLAHAGNVTFIATLDSYGDKKAWDIRRPTAKTSSSGRYFAFNTTRQLTEYDNTDANNGKPDYEIFLYDAVAGTLACASCLPSGERPAAGAVLREPNLAVWNAGYPPRNVSDNGHVFFETTDALVTRDTNGRRDVYQYRDGLVSLLSAGTGEEGTHFVDATPDGHDVFITTPQRLVRRDSDQVYDYYDVRIGGGFREVPPPPGCELEGCRGAGTSASPGPTPSTSQFAGPGNSTRLTCARKFVKRRGRCVRRRHHSDRRKRDRQSHHRAASLDGGAVR